MAKAKKAAPKRNAARSAAVNAELDAKLGADAKPFTDISFPMLDRVATGSLLFDWALDGGIPLGRLTELYGPPSSGKSALGLLLLGQMQKLGQPVLYVDAERSFDPDWAKKFGLDPYSTKAPFYIKQPYTGEEVVRTLESWVPKYGIRGVVFDSIPAARPEEELVGDISEVKMGAMSRLWSKALPRLQPLFGDLHCAGVFINQIRANLSSNNPYDRITTGGGYALQHAYTVRAEMLPSTRIRLNDKTDIGFFTRLKVTKNRGVMNRVVRVPFIQGVGWSPKREVLDLALEGDLIVQSGSWYKLKDDTSIGQGYEAAVQWLVDHPDVYDTLYKQVREGLYNGSIKPPQPGAE